MFSFSDPLWEDLRGHNKNVVTEIRHRTSSQLGGIYGSTGRRSPMHVRQGATLIEESYDGVDGSSVTIDENDPLLQVRPLSVLRLINSNTLQAQSFCGQSAHKN